LLGACRIAPPNWYTLVSDHPLTSRILAELTLARNMLERAIPPGSKLFPAVRALRRTQQRLDRPLRLAICGESNSGKSSLANLLGRIESLPTAAISNTRIPTLIYYAHEPQIWVVHGAPGQRARLRADPRALPRSIFRLEVGLPSPRLREVEILDCPGLADQINFASHAVDAALWCTVCIQAWKESERAAWSQLPARLRSCGLLVATHADLLSDDRDRDKLLTRLRGECGSMFRDIIQVATIDALALVQDGSRALDAWHATGADMLDRALSALVDDARDQRASSALRVTGRIAHHALTSIG
jgi:50S ribosome-binding GTPase